MWEVNALLNKAYELESALSVFFTRLTELSHLFATMVHAIDFEHDDSERKENERMDRLKGTGQIA